MQATKYQATGHGIEKRTQPESLEELKARVRIAVPKIGQSIRSWSSGAAGPATWTGTVKYGAMAADRNTIYASTWHHLDRDRGRYWFQAASMVTGRGGIKDMEGWLAKAGAALIPSRWLPMEGSDIDLLIAGNQFLFPYNLHNFFCLRERGEIAGFEQLRGRELDRGLVVLEQTMVQTFLDSRPWKDDNEKASSLRRISKGFVSFAVNGWVRDELLHIFGDRFDFGRLDSRIALGFALVERLRTIAT